MDGHTEKIMQMSRETLCACKPQLVTNHCTKSYRQRTSKYPTQGHRTKNTKNDTVTGCANHSVWFSTAPLVQQTKAWKEAIITATASPWRGGAALHHVSMAPLKPGSGAENEGERVGRPPESLHKEVLVWFSSLRPSQAQSEHLVLLRGATHCGRLYWTVVCKTAHVLLMD